MFLCSGSTFLFLTWEGILKAVEGKKEGEGKFTGDFMPSNSDDDNLLVHCKEEDSECLGITQKWRKWQHYNLVILLPIVGVW